MLNFEDFRLALTNATAEDKEINKKLVERYPFIKPYYVMTGNDIEDYEYDYTFLDDMPKGWKKRFGVALCEEIRNDLLNIKLSDKEIKNEKDWNENASFPTGTALDTYRLFQVKEKYGSLRWYDNGVPKQSRVNDIVRKYETISEHVCVKCGKPKVPLLDDGWVSPWCKECWEKDRQEWVHEKKYEDYIIEDCDIPSILQFRQSSLDGEKIIKIDISETMNNIHWDEKK